MINKLIWSTLWRNMNLTDIITKSPMLFMFYYKVVVHENFHNEINLLIIIYVSDRREKHKLVQFYKMTKKLTPHYISCLVPQAFANIHDNNTRNASALPVVRTRTSLYYHVKVIK
jgi:hypothetical protein